LERSWRQAELMLSDPTRPGICDLRPEIWSRDIGMVNRRAYRPWLAMTSMSRSCGRA